ncbi:DUF1611 domain-containing protein [Sphingopyxis solisilvae]|uniref:DUF1611 domain-containing protein n=1 Tax=Sphingopyxis solisilvae TaxID=1886788 RepID=UPI001892A9CA|nr:DUF1611 domain-containing protein [Sphingopyxis solisilvae]
MGLLDRLPDKCAGQNPLENCKVDLGLSEIDFEQARARDAQRMVIGVSSFGGTIADNWVASIVAAMQAGLTIASCRRAPGSACRLIFDGGNNQFAVLLERPIEIHNLSQKYSLQLPKIPNQTRVYCRISANKGIIFNVIKNLQATCRPSQPVSCRHYHAAMPACPLGKSSPRRYL